LPIRPGSVAQSYGVAVTRRVGDESRAPVSPRRAAHASLGAGISTRSPVPACGHPTPTSETRRRLCRASLHPHRARYGLHVRRAAPRRGLCTDRRAALLEALRNAIASEPTRVLTALRRRWR